MGGSGVTFELNNSFPLFNDGSVSEVSSVEYERDGVFILSQETSIGIGSQGTRMPQVMSILLKLIYNKPHY